MQFFYVKKTVSLQLSHKELFLQSPSLEALATNQIPVENIYCGNIGWEARHAQEIVGADGVVVLPVTQEIQTLLPPAIQPWSAGKDIVTQIQAIVRKRPEKKRQLPVRIALINGVGTMLGDTLVGSSAVEIAIRTLREAVGAVEVHAVLAWNARPGTEEILARSPAISYVQGRSITLENLCTFDAYCDFSDLLIMEGYNRLPLIDFYLNHLGMAPAAVSASEKLPALRLPTALISEAKALLNQHGQGRKMVLVQGLASTPLRSMPDSFMAQLIDDIWNETDACVLLTQPLPEGMAVRYPERLIQLDTWCRSSTDHYLALVIAADALVSIDSLAMHAAAAAKVPGLVIFTTLRPELRLTYAPHLSGVLLPGATTLPTWGKHKTDHRWPEERAAYHQAWERMDRTPILGKLKSILDRADQAPASDLQGPAMTTRKNVLHVGCGHPDPNKLHAAFRTPEWKELRLDIDPAAQPDIVADMRDLSQLPEAHVDAIWSSHNLEHLYPHDVPVALKEFRRVLGPTGFALITLPDLQEVARLVADGRLDEPAYVSPAGPIAPLDILYGFRPAMAQGNLFMAHRTGFTARTLAQALLDAGFAMVSVQRNPCAFSLWALAFSTAPGDEELKAAQARMFPLPVQ